MKIIHINQTDTQGGAARAAYRIHRALVEFGIDSRMRVIHSGTGDERVTTGMTPRPIFSRIIQKLQYRWLAYSRRNWHTDNPIIHTFGQNSAGLVGELNTSSADILNLHWIPDILSIADIGQLTKPIVWTLHDMWAFCGGEHYTRDDINARFKQGYNADNRPSGECGPDLNRQTWGAKRRSWLRKRFTIISPSRWMADCARQSILFADASVHVIPNPLDTTALWRPIPREVARVALNLPPDKKLILMGSEWGMTDPRKGGDMVRDAVTQVALQQPGSIELMIYGQPKPKQADIWPCPVHWLGKVNDDRVLVLAYSSADVMVVPSRQDNLPNTAVEAQACGTPVVAFDIGGLPDIVNHRVTGYLARPFEISDLAEGISWVLQKEQRRLIISKAARELAVKKYAELVIAKKYCEVYERTLAEYS